MCEFGTSQASQRARGEAGEFLGVV